MKMNNRFLYGVLSIVLAAVIAFVGIPIVTRGTRGTQEIVRLKNRVARGAVISAEDLEVVTVGSYNLPDGIATTTDEVAGNYAAADLYPGDYVLPQKLSATPLSSDQSLNEIPDGKVAISITVQHLANGLSDKLQAGDIIRLYHYDNTEGFLEPVVDVPELHFLKVLSVTDSSGVDVDYSMPLAEDEEHRQTATITLLATPQQALLLTRFENEGVLHAALICRCNETLAKELLKRQDETLLELYGDESGDGEAPDETEDSCNESSIDRESENPGEETKGGGE